MIALCPEAVELADQIVQQGGMLDAPNHPGVDPSVEVFTARASR